MAPLLSPLLHGNLKLVATWLPKAHCYTALLLSLLLHGTFTKSVAIWHPKVRCYTIPSLNLLLHGTLTKFVTTQHPKARCYTAPFTKPIATRYPLQSPLLHGTYYKARCYMEPSTKPKYYPWQYFIKNPNTILAKFYKNSNTIKSPSTILGNILSKAHILIW